MPKTERYIACSQGSKFHIVDTLVLTIFPTEYDDRKRYNGAEDNLTLPVDLTTRTTSFATDGLTVVVER